MLARGSPPLRRLVLARSILFILTIALVSVYYHQHGKIGQQDSGYGISKYNHRHLLSTVEWETCTFEVGHPRNDSVPTSEWYTPTSAYGWVALYVLLILIVFVALALICDDFFVPSLEAISEALDLSEDVAGATFMAAGSSAPELFTSIAGVSVESDVGVGTIVGSAVFNLLGIVALSAAFAGQVLHLDWRPFARDATFYALSVALFIVFSWDGKFHFYESVIMLLLYFLYILLMKFNPQLMTFLSKFKKPTVHPATNATQYVQSDCHADADPSSSPASGKDLHREVDVKVISETGSDGRRFSHIKKGELTGPLVCPSHPHPTSDQNGTGQRVVITTSNISTEQGNHEQVQSTGQEFYDDDEPLIVVCPCLPPIEAEFPTKEGHGCFAMLKYILSCILFLVSFPFLVLFTWTIPNCSQPETRKYFLLSFIMSIVWIAILSFAMVTLVGRAGCILGIDKFTMGLVVVAIGTSIPDALSSILVARDGYGDMAVSNAIGSNVFDVDLGIGLPFVISTMIRGMKPVLLLSAHEQAMLESGEIVLIPHAKFGFLLLFILFLSLLVFLCTGFRMTKRLGVVFVMMYLCFVVYAYIQDMHCTHNC